PDSPQLHLLGGDQLHMVGEHLGNQDLALLRQERSQGRKARVFDSITLLPEPAFELCLASRSQQVLAELVLCPFEHSLLMHTSLGRYSMVGVTSGQYRWCKQRAVLHN